MPWKASLGDGKHFDPESCLVKYATFPPWSPNPAGRATSAESQGPHARRNFPCLVSRRMSFGETSAHHNPTLVFQRLQGRVCPTIVSSNELTTVNSDRPLGAPAGTGARRAGGNSQKPQARPFLDGASGR